ncbi:MAG TPA: hypothetical protein VF085_01775 [Solirubrobacterales bacterium]
MALSDADIEAVATRVADLLRTGAQTNTELVDATKIAQRFGVSRDFVYDHADDLGAVRLGNGPKARLRFDPAKVGRALRKPPEKAASQPRRRRTRSSSSLLPIRE